MDLVNWHATLTAAILPIKNPSLVVLGIIYAILYSIIRSSGCVVMEVLDLPLTPFAPILL